MSEIEVTHLQQEDNLSVFTDIIKNRKVTLIP